MRWHTILGLALVSSALSAAAAEPPVGPNPRGFAEPLPREAPPSDAQRELDRIEAANSKTRASLRERRAFTWNNARLGDVAKELSEILAAPVRLDTRALEDAGLDADTPVTLTGAPTTIRRAINLALEPIGLASYVDEGELVITTKEKSDERLIVRVYDVSDLVLIDLDNPLTGANYGPLIDSLQSTVAPETWDTVGGQGAIRPFNAPGIEAILVGQTEPVHEEVDLLLMQIRKVRHQGPRRARNDWLPSKPSSLGSGQGGSAVGPPAPPSGKLPENSDRDRLCDPQLNLACSLLSRLTADADGGAPENVVLSPYGIASALALASAGARGETASEIRQALRIDLPPERLHAAMAAQAKELPIGAFNGVELRVANRLWVQHGKSPPAEDFVRTVRQFYGTELGIVDFASDEARVGINEWTTRQTGGKVRDFLGRDAIDQWTRLILVNAVCFHGAWREPFRVENTSLQPFHAPSGVIDTPTMDGHEIDATYAVDDGVEILGMKYGGSVEMTILLPSATMKFAEFEATITAEKLSRWFAAAKPSTVNVYLPKFTIATNRDLAGVLEASGVRLAFSRDDADFSGIRADQALFLRRCLHRAEIEVDEAGTVAVAATGMILGMGGGPWTPPVIPTFRADRPFVFLIRDTRTETILFMGRITDPSE
jgi:serpin B